MFKCAALLRASIAGLIGVLAVSCSEGSSNGGGSGPVLVQVVDHPAVGHWMGSVTADDGRQIDCCIQVDAAIDQPTVALTYIPAGAFYSPCTVSEAGDQTITFRFDRGKYDNVYHATLSPDGAELSGSISVPAGSKSFLESGTFRLSRIPRATYVPGAMVFSKGMTGMVGAFTLTITVAQVDDGRWVAEVDVPEQSLNDMPLFNVTESNGVITGSFRVMGPPNVFELTLSEDRQRLTGLWRSAGAPTQLDMPRVR
jgi:hypothetical protein